MVAIQFREVERRSWWPDGVPVRVDVLPDGRIRNQMADGRGLIIPPKPGYRLEYASSWPGMTPGAPYSIDVAFKGLCDVPGFVQAWNYDQGALKSYAFTRILRAVHIETGEVMTGRELCDDLGGEWLDVAEVRARMAAPGLGRVS